MDLMNINIFRSLMIFCQNKGSVFFPRNCLFLGIFWGKILWVSKKVFFSFSANEKKNTLHEWVSEWHGKLFLRKKTAQNSKIGLFFFSDWAGIKTTLFSNSNEWMIPKLIPEINPTFEQTYQLPIPKEKNYAFKNI